MLTSMVFGDGDALKMLSSYRIVLEIFRGMVGIARKQVELKEVRVQERVGRAFSNGFWWGAGITAAFFLIYIFAASSARSLIVA